MLIKSYTHIIQRICYNFKSLHKVQISCELSVYYKTEVPVALAAKSVGGEVDRLARTKLYGIVSLY